MKNKRKALDLHPPAATTAQGPGRSRSSRAPFRGALSRAAESSGAPSSRALSARAESVRTMSMRALQRSTGLLGALMLLQLTACSTGDDTRSVEQNVMVPNGDLSSGTLAQGSPITFTATLPAYGPNAVGVSYVDDMYTVSVQLDGATDESVLVLSVEDSPGSGTYVDFQDVTFQEKSSTLDAVVFNIDLDPAVTPGLPTPFAGVPRNYQLTLIGGPAADVLMVDFITIAPLRKTNVADPTTTQLSYPTAGDPELPSEVCGGCHVRQMDEWRSSMMGYSSISPPIHALELTENHVTPANMDRVPVPEVGRLARDPDAPLNMAHGQSQSHLFCQRCHAPIAVFTDVFRVFDFDSPLTFTDTNRGDYPDTHTLLRLIIGADDITPAESFLRSADWDGDGMIGDGSPGAVEDFRSSPDLGKIQADALAATEGVTCTVCHSINGIDDDDSGMMPPRPGFDPGVANTAFRVVHNGVGDNGAGEVRINFGPFDDNEVNALHPAAPSHGQMQVLLGTDGIPRPFIQTGELCGTCHDVRIPAEDPGTGEDFRRVENLFTEWRDSPWNNNNTNSAANVTTFENPRGFSGAAGLDNLKRSTTCQDCHMSEFPIRESADPGDYPMGPIATGGPNVRISNHRFIGVDRFLTHDRPRFGEAASSQDDELEEYDIAEADGSLVGASTDLAHLNLGSLPPGESRDLREILLQKAADFRIENVGQVSGDLLPISVSVENVGVGHNLPAGLSQERQVWIELEVLDANGGHVYTSGYLNPLPGSGEDMFEPGGSMRYGDSFCATHEYECELDFFRIPEDAEIGPYLNLVPDTPGDPVMFAPGADEMLSNYQNGFTLGEYDPEQPLQNKVLTQFIADRIINTNSLAPFVKKTEQYMIPVSKVAPEIRNGPYTVNARLRFRPLPLEFLEALQKALGGDPDTSTVPFPTRISHDVIERNKVIEMEQDSCVTGGFAKTPLRACGRADDGTSTTLAAGLGHTCVSWGDEVADPGAHDTDSIANRGDYVRYTQCFGDNQFGQVGAGVRLGGGADERTAVTVDLINQSTLSAGDEHTCALHRGGTVSCWGAGSGGRLGDGDGSNHNSTGPREIDSTNLSGVSTLASAASSTCAVTKGNSPEEDGVYCWGDGAPGELGSGGAPVAEVKTVPSEVAVTASGEPLRGIEQIAAGATHYCVVADGRKLDENGSPDFDGLGNPAYSGGHVYCWGAGPGNGQSDGGAATNVANPSPVSLPYQATKVAAGEDFSCALLTNGDVYCWGSNQDGRLGVGDAGLSQSLTPLRISQGETRAYDLTAGRNHACIAETFSAAPLTHNVRCWGDGENGKNGDLSENDRFFPQIIGYDPIGDGGTLVPDGFTGIVAMAAGAEHTCVVSDGSTVGLAAVGMYCWGDNSSGQLGMDDVTGSLSIATKLRFYDKMDPSDPSDDVAGDLPDPMITGRSYYATESRGGPGESGCLVAQAPFQVCVDEVDLVDVNDGDHFRYFVDAFGGMTELHFEVSKLDGFRAMEVFLNGNPTGMLISAGPGMAGRVGTAPDRSGLELPPITLDLQPGINEIVLVDNQGTAEFDMHRVRLVRTQAGTCFDDATNNGETDVDCGGPFCEGCEIDEICGQDSDCLSSNCESGLCAIPPEDPPCTLASAIDMGAHGASSFVTSDACLKLTQYPPWWDPRPLKIRRDGGTVNMSFSWDNTGGGACDPLSMGTGNYSSGIDEVVVGDGVDEHSPPPNTLVESTVSDACPTLIQLNGDGTPVEIRWWAN